jgi:hypothetical protein
MTIANATRKVAEITYAGKLFSFEDDVVVAKALKFCETHCLGAPIQNRER